MIKFEIFKKLEELNLDKEKYIVIGDASLVCHGVIDEANDITILCCDEIFDLLDWPSREEDGTLVKYRGMINISKSLYDDKCIDIIDGYCFSNIISCYELKKKLNKKEDKKLIQKLELMVCSQNNYYFESKLKSQGVKYIAGVDEVGRGPLVGPVVAACVILPDTFSLDGLTDSKKLSEKKRDYYYDEIMKQALGVGVGIVSEKVIDEVNIYEATKRAMKEAILDCNIKPEHILIDAMPLSLEIPTTSIIKGDLKSITISAASVIAKVTRDRMLDELDKKYPMYDFKDNKGYPTKKHIEAIHTYGIIDEHRRSYGPVKDYLEKQLSLF